MEGSFCDYTATPPSPLPFLRPLPFFSRDNSPGEVYGLPNPPPASPGSDSEPGSSPLAAPHPAARPSIPRGGVWPLTLNGCAWAGGGWGRSSCRVPQGAVRSQAGPRQQIGKQHPSPPGAKGCRQPGPPEQRLTAPAQPGLAGLPLGSTLLEIHSLRGSRRPGEVLSTSCVLTPYSRDQIQQLPFTDWKTGPEKPEEAGC